MMRKLYTIIPLTIVVCSCTLFYPACRHNDSILTIMTWNVENLFDDINNGTEYHDFIPGEENWTAEDFHGKMASLSEAIRQIKKGGPDILLLQEIENENVLNIFADTYLKGMSYNHRIFSKEEYQAAGTAVLSRIPMEAVYTHISDKTGVATGRPIVEVHFIVEESSIVIFNNHWKSKSGGEKETEPARREAAYILNRRISLLLEEEPDRPVIIAGDLNEDIDEFEKCDPAYPTALLDIKNLEHFTELYPETDTEKNLLFTQNITPSNNSTSLGLPLLYSCWTDSETGSYFFRKSWERIDHFFLSSSLVDESGMELKDFTVCNYDFLIYPDGGPIKWNRERGEGYSDHLPLILEIFLKD
ncbi:MAG: endonuclease/exonuclease/phosphatase family protein [Spirochaetales bacterium]|nr:endonuclease/exonuclease/phosphatase family protein [Spirochaetales bacterium]